MRLVVCLVVCAACGRAERESNPQIAGGGASGAASAGAADTNQAGTSTSTGTGAGGAEAGSANGGTASAGAPKTMPGPTPSGGSAGAGDNVAGTTHAGGVGGEDVLDGGAAGSAGGGETAACGGEYEACGCGCCFGAAPQARCYYPARGESVAAIAQADREASMNPNCSAAGCAAPVRWLCCAATSVDPGAGNYDVTTYIGGLDRLTVHRESPEGRCTILELVRPRPPSEAFAIQVPDGFAVGQGWDYACVDENSARADSRRAPIGGVGSVAWTAPGQCSLEVDVTLFFPSDAGAVDEVRLRSARLPVEGYGSKACEL